MGLRERWSELDRLCRLAQQFSGLQVWGFGSMLQTERPNDLDVLVIYTRRADVAALRNLHLWEVNLPPIDLIAMTPDEAREYQFIEITNALRLC